MVRIPSLLSALGKDVEKDISSVGEVNAVSSEEWATMRVLF